jgi:hypothetical protein
MAGREPEKQAESKKQQKKQQKSTTKEDGSAGTTADINEKLLEAASREGLLRANESTTKIRSTKAQAKADGVRAATRGTAAKGNAPVKSKVRVSALCDEVTSTWSTGLGGGTRRGRREMAKLEDERLASLLLSTASSSASASHN